MVVAQSTVSHTWCGDSHEAHGEVGRSRCLMADV